MMQGKVKWYSVQKGHGVIEPFDGGPDYSVQKEDIVAHGHMALYEEQTVEFEIAQGANGPRAVNVRPM
ncbi:cold-shock protein [Pandoraea aquatica]|uniref:Cold-shock protein n=1 Tax=Pandoraea aquatica TaxID=2508290 RepID=A0A5E4YB11_9BURK|nr:cold shock domain-containing protein [Pandoraea aquatica]VVE45608.1 cold-shock protein [Pandoraea aquatica]